MSFFEWRKNPKGRLAEIIVLDQFSRNIYRGLPESFVADSLALTLAQEAVADAHDELEPLRKSIPLHVLLCTVSLSSFKTSPFVLFRKSLGIENNLVLCNTNTGG